jgi:hypothetical protein
MLGNLHPLVQSSVLDQMETQPKLVVVLDTMIFLDGLCFARIDGWNVAHENAHKDTDNFPLSRYMNGASNSI